MTEKRTEIPLSVRSISTLLGRITHQCKTPPDTGQCIRHKIAFRLISLSSGYSTWYANVANLRSNRQLLQIKQHAASRMNNYTFVSATFRYDIPPKNHNSAMLRNLVDTSSDGPQGTERWLKRAQYTNPFPFLHVLPFLGWPQNPQQLQKKL